MRHLAAASAGHRRHRRLGLRFLELEKKFLLQNFQQWICIYEKKSKKIFIFLYYNQFSSNSIFLLQNAYEMVKHNLKVV